MKFFQEKRGMSMFLVILILVLFVGGLWIAGSSKVIHNSWNIVSQTKKGLIPEIADEIALNLDTETTYGAVKVAWSVNSSENPVKAQEKIEEYEIFFQRKGEPLGSIHSEKIKKEGVRRDYEKHLPGLIDGEIYEVVVKAIDQKGNTIGEARRFFGFYTQNHLEYADYVINAKRQRSIDKLGKKGVDKYLEELFKTNTRIQVSQACRNQYLDELSKGRNAVTFSQCNKQDIAQIFVLVVNKLCDECYSAYITTHPSFKEKYIKEYYDIYKELICPAMQEMQSYYDSYNMASFDLLCG